MQKTGPSSRTSDYPLGGTKSFTLKLWRSCRTYGEDWEEDGLWTLRTLPYKYFFPPWLHTTDRQQAHRPWGSKTPEVAIANFDNGEHNWAASSNMSHTSADHYCCTRFALSLISAMTFEPRRQRFDAFRRKIVPCYQDAAANLSWRNFVHSAQEWERCV